MNATEELLPCPFCGGEAHFAVSSDGYAVECDGELCLRNAMQEHPSEEYAALWWNTRVQGTCEVEGYDDGIDEGMDGEWYSYGPPTWYLSCGHETYGSTRPCYCSACGRKVV